MGEPSTQRFYIETLGCPKNAVDSDKVVASLVADGLTQASGPGDADVVVVNTCAFIEAARQESIDTILELSAVRKPGAKLVVTGCLAARAGDGLAPPRPTPSWGAQARVRSRSPCRSVHHAASRRVCETSSSSRGRPRRCRGRTS